MATVIVFALVSEDVTSGQVVTEKQKDTCHRCIHQDSVLALLRRRVDFLQQMIPVKYCFVKRVLDVGQLYHTNDSTSTISKQV
jgi:hypothetical protein